LDDFGDLVQRPSDHESAVLDDLYPDKYWV